jgi:hypothetical protein
VTVAVAAAWVVVAERAAAEPEVREAPAAALAEQAWGAAQERAGELAPAPGRAAVARPQST